MGRNNHIKKHRRHSEFNLNRKRFLTVLLSVIVVFFVTSLLTLPASTLEKKVAEKQGGIDVYSEAGKDGEGRSLKTAAAKENSAEQDAEQAKDQADSKTVKNHEKSGAEKKAAEKSARTSGQDAASDRDAGKDANSRNESSEASGEEKNSGSGELRYSGSGYDVEASYGEKARIPEDAEISVKEIEEETDAKKYAKYYDQALEAIQEDAGTDGSAADRNDSGAKDSGKAQVAELKFAKFYDITLTSDGDEIEPEDTVKVSISYDQALPAGEADHVRIVHFTEDQSTGKTTAEVLEDKSVDATVRSGKLTEASFDAESFSVYAVVYTVDYEFEVDGKKYRFSMNGEDAVSLRDLAKELHLYEGKERAGDAADEKLERFIDTVEDVKFSNPKLLAVVKAEEDTTLGKLKAKNKISQDFAAWKNQGEVEERNSVEFKEGDWALISLKPFDTKEKLTITLDTEEEIVVTVTDAQDANMKAAEAENLLQQKVSENNVYQVASVKAEELRQNTENELREIKEKTFQYLDGVMNDIERYTNDLAQDIRIERSELSKRR